MAGECTRPGGCPRDTDPAIYRRWIEGLRQMTFEQRLTKAMNLSQMVINMSRRAIALAHPQWSDEEVKIEFVRLHYGAELANGVREKLKGEPHHELL
ncbi:MAG: hypothetical protein ABFD92_15720 [Planctomycetaceae bacterium]|nr:hypothetical protein [Planctomycetaceae bacterium]